MYKTEELKYKKSKSNAHVSKQFRLTNNSVKEKGQPKIWPEAFNPFTSNQKTFPESPSLFPAYRH